MSRSSMSLSASHPNSGSQPSPPLAPLLRTIPLPSEDEQAPVIINALLAVPPPSTHILYDFSLPTVASITPQHPLFELTNWTFATEPPSSSLAIISPQLGRLIMIERPSDDFVSVLDVINGIHNFLHEDVDQAEYNELPPELQNRSEETYRTRCSNIADPELQSVELGKGLKRVDLLLGVHEFAGLSGTINGPNIWELHLRESN